MIALAFLALQMALTSVELVDEVYTIPANDWRYVPVGLNQKPAFVSAHFDVTSPSRRVRLALMRADDLERMREGAPHGVIAVTEFLPKGQLAYQVRTPGDYVILVDNREQPAAQVHLRVRADFAAPRGPLVIRLPRERQLTVIVVSFAVFFGIVTYSARRLLRGMRR
jgi:hypothetical protein